MLKNIREAIRKAGGCIDGNFRFSIMWNDEETRAIVDLDAHAIQPDGQEIYYAQYRKPLMTSISGQLDVDMIRPTTIGIENIYWTDLEKLLDGTYKFFIHNYDGGENKGCNAELFFKGKLWQYAIPHEIKRSKDEVVAVVTLKDRKIVNVKHCPYLVEEMDLITRFN
jgi:hypothetical protein